MIGDADNKFDLGDHVYESDLLKETIDEIILTKTVLVYASRAEPGDDMWKCRGSARVYMETRASWHSLWKINLLRVSRSLRKQPSFFAPSPSGVISMEFSAVNRRRPSRETPLGPGAKKDGCFRRLGFT